MEEDVDCGVVLRESAQRSQFLWRLHGTTFSTLARKVYKLEQKLLV